MVQGKALRLGLVSGILGRVGHHACLYRRPRENIHRHRPALAFGERPADRFRAELHYYYGPVSHYLLQERGEASLALGEIRHT